ncbi:diguanylate cyclase [Bacillus kexueae]|uniref:GGDEF domain-containing response regulator n=1 Tax=Aeribacillus kexueae TaxID=2078952 RepID=UPI001FAFC834|nr:diguanylate cyclase [Bacillus kexueae]
MDKYKQHFFNNIRTKLEQWESLSEITNEEVYRFLHSLAGTSSIIGLQKIGDKARVLMEQLDETSDRKWTFEEVKRYLIEIIEDCYEYEEGINTSLTKSKVRNSNEPVLLIIDDDTSFLMFLKEKLEAIGWYVVAIANPEKAILSFYDVRPDCVIIDIYMNEKNGFEVLEFLKQKLKQQFIPTVMVSVEKEKSIRMKSYEMGADDFIHKPFELDEFIVRIKRQLERKKQIDELLLLDELTHVYNRKYLKQAYAQVQNEWKRSKEDYSLAVLDIDYFKKVNDRFGHLVGDVVLKEFANILKRETRIKDIVFRYGGEEFVILFPKTNVDEAMEVLNRLRENFSQYVFHQEESFSCTFSAGVVQILDATKPFEKWLELADQALYEAKNNGRNRIEQADKPKVMQHQKTVKMAIVDDDPIIRTVMADIIKKLPLNPKRKIELQTYKDGKAFIQSDWHLGDPCFVILDGVMPNMDGLEVLTNLKSKKDANRYRVLMLTSRKGDQDIAKALELGADDYMTKPFKFDEIIGRIEKMLQRMM